MPKTIKDRRIVLYILIAISYLPVIIFPTLAIINSLFDIQGDLLLIVGSILGITGFIMLFWQYVLGNKSIVRIFTVDYFSLNSLHQFFGMYGIISIFFHPVLVFFYYLISLGLNIINFDFSTNFNLHVKIGTIAFTLLFSTWILNTFLKKKIAFRLWKRIHLFYYFLLPIVYLHADDIGVFSGSTLIGLYIKFLTGLFILIFIYRILLQLGVFKKKYTVLSTSKVTNDVVQIDLKPKNKAVIPLKGQFITIQLDLLKETHPFTVAAFDANVITLAVKNSGEFSKSLINIKPGTKVLIDGPYGVFTREAYQDNRDKIILIAGGIGITPFLRLLHFASQNPGKFKEIYLFYGNRTEKDIAYLNEINQIASTSNLKVINALSKETSNKNYEKGYINSNLIKKYIKSDIKEYEIFICGPQLMMDSLKADLLKSNTSIKRIHSEEFSF